MSKKEIKKAIEELQVWFASRTWGWRETATAGQIQQHDDRVVELENLVRKLSRM